MLEIEIIHTPEELENTAKISVKYELWGTENMPETYAKMGYILHDGFYVKMVCMEKNPLRKYKNHKDPVSPKNSTTVSSSSFSSSPKKNSMALSLSRRRVRYCSAIG